VIRIRAEHCDGCGACLEVCPNGALYLIEGKAVVDGALCQECEACVPACPTEAIAIVEQVTAAAPTRVPAIRPEPKAVLAESQPAPVPMRVRVLPVMGAALSWAGRELVPRLAYYLLDGLDRRAIGQPTSSITRGGSSSSGRRGSERQQRRRHRGGRGSSG
jgi:NAD-dependent dihydropyrimidine dehydrogenase PreA subunit